MKWLSALDYSQEIFRCFLNYFTMLWQKPGKINANEGSWRNSRRLRLLGAYGQWKCHRDRIRDFDHGLQRLNQVAIFEMRR